MIQMLAIAALLSATNGYADWRDWFRRNPSSYRPSEQELNVKHKTLMDEIKEQKESVDIHQSLANQYPTDENQKAYLKNQQQILRALENSGNQIYYEVKDTGTSKTLLRQAPLQEQRNGSFLNVEKNAPALSTIQRLQMKKELAEQKQPSPTPALSYWSRFKSLFTPNLDYGPKYTKLPLEQQTRNFDGKEETAMVAALPLEENKMYSIKTTKAGDMWIKPTPNKTLEDREETGFSVGFVPDQEQVAPYYYEPEKKNQKLHISGPTNTPEGKFYTVDRNTGHISKEATDMPASKTFYVVKPYRKPTNFYSPKYKQFEEQYKHLYPGE